jgi:hypothetical protein
VGVEKVFSVETSFGTSEVGHFWNSTQATSKPLF